MDRFLQRPWPLAVLFLFLGILVYGHSMIMNEFVNWDDLGLITENPILQSLSWAHIKAAFTSYDPDLYIPFTLLSYHIDRIIAGGTFVPQVTHALNLLLHVGNTLLAVLIAQSLSKNRTVGIVAGLLFLLHPVHTEAVVWASARKDLLSIFFTLFSVHFWVARRGKHWYAWSFVLFLCALFSKVIAIVLPPILLVHAWHRNGAIDKVTLKNTVPFFGFSIAFFIVAMAGQEGDFMLIEKMLMAPRSTVLYLSKLMLPRELSLLYPFTDSITILHPALWSSLLFLICLTALFVSLARYRRAPLALWLCFLIALVPTFSNFTKGDTLVMDVYIGSDRYAYLPSIALLIGFAVLWHRLFLRRKALAVTLLSVILSAYAFLSYRQSLVWKETATLFLNVIAHHDNSHLAHTNFGVELIRRGFPELAEQQFQQSNAIRPNEKAYHRLAQLARKRGDIDASRILYLEGLKLNPYHAELNAELGNLFLELKRPEETLKLSEVAAEIDPGNLQAMLDTARAYEMLGDVQKAAEWRRKAEALQQ